MYTNASGSLLTDSKITLYQDDVELASAMGADPVFEDLVLESDSDIFVAVENNDGTGLDGPGYYYQGFIAVGYTP